MSSNPCNYTNYGGGEHQTADQRCIVSKAVRLQEKLCGNGHAPRHMGCTPALRLWHRSATATTVCGLRHYISVICLCLSYTNLFRHYYQMKVKNVGKVGSLTLQTLVCSFSNPRVSLIDVAYEVSGSMYIRLLAVCSSTETLDIIAVVVDITSLSMRDVSGWSIADDTADIWPRPA